MGESGADVTHDQKVIWSKVARERDRVIGAFHTPMWNAMLDTVGAKARTHLFDAGCGSGGASVLALARGATVTGMDISPEMVRVCRERMVTGARFEIGSIQNLPFRDASFDAVISCMVVHFCSDPLRALGELARVSKPGARIAISAPASHDEDILLAVKVAAELRPNDAVDIIRPLMFTGEGTLARCLAAAGLHDVKETIVDLQVGPTSFDAAWALIKTFGVVATTIDRVGEERFLEAYRPRLRHCYSGDTVTLSSKYRVVCGVR